MNQKNWSNVFRIVLILDSGIFLCKLALAVWMIVFGIREQIQFNQEEKYDNSYLYQLVLALLFIGSGISLIFIVLRWIANVSQYRNEAAVGSSVSTNLKSLRCGFCNTCWFVVPHIVINGILIGEDWTDSGWLQKTAIIFLCWEILIIIFMAVYKFQLHFKADKIDTVAEENQKDSEEGM